MLPMKQVYQGTKPMSLSIPPLVQSAFRFSDLSTLARPFRAGPALLEIFATRRERARTRRQLSTLTDRELADVGLTRTQQRDECAKPFWQL
jgi:uncharacterized protein YjiS (DUF1127 family)